LKRANQVLQQNQAQLTHHLDASIIKEEDKFIGHVTERDLDEFGNGIAPDGDSIEISIKTDDLKDAYNEIK
jgi:hypothetical protein